MMTLQAQTENETGAIEIACRLTGAEQVQRQGEVAALFGQAQQVEELADGYALAYPSDTDVQALVDFIVFERRCCPFYTFELIFEPGPGLVWLRMRGPAGAKEIVQSSLDLVQVS